MQTLGQHVHDALQKRDPRIAVSATLEPASVERWTRELLTAIKRTHDCGLAHYDITSSNALLHHTGALALADFGSARLLTVALRHKDLIELMDVVRWLAACV